MEERGYSLGPQGTDHPRPIQQRRDTFLRDSWSDFVTWPENPPESVSPRAPDRPGLRSRTSRSFPLRPKPPPPPSAAAHTWTLPVSPWVPAEGGSGADTAVRPPSRPGGRDPAAWSGRRPRGPRGFLAGPAAPEPTASARSSGTPRAAHGCPAYSRVSRPGRSTEHGRRPPLPAGKPPAPPDTWGPSAAAAPGQSSRSPHGNERRQPRRAAKGQERSVRGGKRNFLP